VSAGRVAVTGASGFVARTLIPRLKAGGYHVTAITRGDAMPPGANAVVSITSLSDEPQLLAAFRGADAVVHLAARAHVIRDAARDPLDAFRQVNTVGAAAVMRAAVAAGVPRVVALSSAGVMGPATPTPYHDDDVPDPHGAYAQSKYEGELAMDRLAGSNTLLTHIRPPVVYGPGVSGNLRRLLQIARLARRVPLPLGGVRNARSMIGSDNLADAIQRCLEHPTGLPGAYLVSDGRAWSLPELLRFLAAANGAAAHLIPIPDAPIRWAARLMGGRADVDRLLGSFVVADSRFREATGWTPPVAPETGVAAMAMAEW
jgi:nucleoside-diphosphate-sugar epimerase